MRSTGGRAMGESRKSALNDWRRVVPRFTSTGTIENELRRVARSFDLEPARSGTVASGKALSGQLEVCVVISVATFSDEQASGAV